MKTTLSRMKLKKNAGVAMISIIIAVAFISIIGSALLYITFLNYQMKVQNLQSKENFYETDGQLTQITTNLRNEIMKSGDPKQNLQTILGVDFTTGGNYRVDNLAKYVSYIEDDKFTSLNEDNTIVQAKTSASNALTGEDTFTYSGGTCEVVTVYDEHGNVVPTPNPVTYRLKDFTIEQKSADGYVNKVRTDIDIQILTKSVSSSGEGGVGSFSLLMDAPFKVNNASFNILNLYGNCLFSKYESTPVKWDVDNVFYTAPGKKDSAGAALEMGKESKINVIGQYLIVYGDLVLNDSACLYINNGNLTVYGDIYLNKDSTIVCTGNIYQLKDKKLPGRGDVSKIYIEGKEYDLCTESEKAKHIYPKTCNSVSITEKNYQSFTKTIKLNNNDTSDDGVLYQLMEEYKGHKLTDASIGKSVDQIEGESNYGNYYGQQIGVAFSGKNNDLNGKYKNRLVFIAGDEAKIQEGNLGCTFLCKSGINLEQAHSVSLTKIGSSTFNFLMIKSSDEGNKDYQKNVHKWVLGDFGNDLKDGFSFGDFFVDDPDKIVNDMLACGNGSDGGDSSGAEKKNKYESAISFIEYQKDFE